MKHFKEIPPYEIDRILTRIGKEWMLVSAGDKGSSNTMTASWGCMGVLWNKPVAVCFIRPQRYTYTFTETHDRLSLSFFDGGYRDALTLCGRLSGRDVDKFAAAGLTLACTDDGVPYPEEASLVLVCKKLYVDDLKKSSFLDESLLSNYPADDFHRVYVCEIEKVLSRHSTD
ncbi:MAG: flavin reductase family protein [Ruminococcaceae bacterium]|nr:flavin reductase family protein [Oscillospiraceae bacterium]